MYTKKMLDQSFHVHLAMSKPVYIIFAVSIMFIMTSHAANNSNTTMPAICAPSHCGNGIPIQYPFWKIPNATTGPVGFCGYPEFGLNCSKDGRPIIKLITDSYFVTDINYDSYSITLLDIDVVNQKCPRAKHSVSLGSYPLSFNQLDQNITFYFNCSSYPAISPIPCLDANNSVGKKSFVFYAGQENNVGYDWQSHCDDKIVVTVKQSEIQSAGLIDGFGVAMNKGFVLNWSRAVNCAECELSGGYCGFNETAKLPICMCEDGRIVAKSCKGSRWTLRAKLGVGAAAAVLVILVVVSMAFYYRQRRKKTHDGISYVQPRSMSSDPSSLKDTEIGSTNYGIHLFTYSELEEATNYFDPSKELGEGGFGTVYYGKLRDGRCVAVKRLYENNYKRVEQFKNEIQILTDLHHKNLVSLYGCTSRHSRELLLVYEYIPNGTVADHLHGERAKAGKLPWHIRMNIAVETASALAYLHASEVIHRDVKTNNILLDSHFVVKVADFGLSRLFPTNVTHVSTTPQGTPGYVDPEYHECYQLTVKSDVYSFGVVLVELISSLPAVDITRHRHEINLSNMAINKIHNQALHELVDPNLGFDSDYKVRKMINAVAELAFQCLQSSKDMRPSMAEVLDTLRDIQSDGKYKSQPEVMDISTEDDVVLLKDDPPPPSPDSNVVSKSTTPNASG